MQNLEEWPHIFDFPKTGKWRVKLCRLGQENWDIFGEGEIYGEYDQLTNEYVLLVTKPDEVPCVLFRSIIKSPSTFQKQDTMLLWTGSEKDILYSGGDKCSWTDENGLARMAIGFQAATGCASMAEFVLYANSKLPKEDQIVFTVQQPGGADGNFDRTAEVVDKPIVLPPLPNKLNLTIVLNMISELLTFHLSREFLIVYLDATQYLDQIWLVFEEIRPSKAISDSTDNSNSADKLAHSSSESPLEVIQILWTISDIVKQYCLVGDSYLLEEMIEADRFSKVLQMLEYDRTFGMRKSNFSEYYKKHTALKQVFELTDAPVIEKIHRTFRLQLLRDILVRCADDFAFHILRSLIYMNHSEIMEKLQNSPEFCDNLFGLFDESPYKPANQTTAIKDDAIRFIYDIMKTSKTFAYSQLQPLYLTLIDSGLISALNYGINSARDNEIKMLALESLSILLEFDINLVMPSRQSILEAIMRLAVDQKLKPDSFSEYNATRAVNIEIAEILKKLLLDLPTETMQIFFLNLRNLLVEADESQKTSPMMLAPFLEILTYCFTCHPDITGTLMMKYNIWCLLAAVFVHRNKKKDAELEGILPKQPKPEVRLSPVESLQMKFDRNHGSAQIEMALIRLVRDSIQPPVATSTIQCADQANSIIKSGLFSALVKSHVRKYTQQSITHDAEQSSFLNLLYTIVDGENHTSAQQFKIFTSWLKTEGRSEVKVLAKKYPFLRCLLSDMSREEWQREMSLKRLHTNQQAQSDAPLHHPQRARAGPMLPPIQKVDEIDDEVYVLPGPASLANALQRESPETLKAVEETQPPSPPRNQNTGKQDRAGTEKPPANQLAPPIAVFEDTGFREMSPPPPALPHPWWDSKKVGHGLENSG